MLILLFKLRVHHEREREKDVEDRKGSSHYKWMARRSPFRRMKIRLQGLANDFVCVPKKIPTHPLLLLFARSKITQSLIKGIRNGMRLCEPFIPVRYTLHEMPNGQEIVKIGPFLQYKLNVLTK